MKTKFFFMAAALFGMFAMASCSDDDKNEIDPTVVPTQFTEALKQVYPNATDVKWDVNGNYRTAEFEKNNGQVEVEVWFNQQASVAMTNEDYGKNLFYIPGSVGLAYTQSDFGKSPWAVEDIDMYEIGTNTYYVIEAEATGEQDAYLVISDEGQIIKTVRGTMPDITPDTQFE